MSLHELTDANTQTGSFTSTTATSPTTDLETDTDGDAANYSCPHCDRPTLARTPEEIVAFRCGACDGVVRELEGQA